MLYFGCNETSDFSGEITFDKILRKNLPFIIATLIKVW